MNRRSNPGEVEPCGIDQEVRSRWIRTAAAFLVPIALVLLAYRTSPTFQLVGDAVFLIEENPWMRRLDALPAMLSHDYFWSPAGEAIGYWRPLTKASWLLETVLGDGRPWVYQAVQIAWLAAATAGVAFLGLTLGLTAVPAACAAILFGLHPAAVEPASLVMARSDLACAAGTIWAVAAWIRWRTSAEHRWLALHLGAAVVAFASKEAAVILVPLLAIWSLLGTGGPHSRRRFFAGVAPVAALVGLYLAARGAFLGAGAAMPLAGSPLKIFVGGGTYLQGLLPFTLATGIRNIPIAEAAAAARLTQASAAWAAAIGFALLCRRLRWREGLLLIAWAVGGFTLVLIGAQARVPGALGKIALADRWLFAAVAPACLFFAGLLPRVAGARIRTLAGAAVAAWAAVVVLFAPGLHAPYGDRVSLLSLEDTQYETTPPQFRTPEDDCRRQERVLVRATRAGDGAAALAAYERLHADPACRLTTNTEITMLSLLLATDQPREALPIAEKLAAPGRLHGRFRFQGLSLAAETLFRNGRPGQAVALVESAVRSSPEDGGLRELLARAYAAAGQVREAGELRARGSVPMDP